MQRGMNNRVEEVCVYHNVCSWEKDWARTLATSLTRVGVGER